MQENLWWDKSWNPISGCSKVSEACKFCWAEAMAKRFWGDRKFTDVQCHPERLEQPLHWRKPRRIFVCSMGDLFYEKVPFEFIDKVFGVMSANPWHIYQLLTKRPKRLAQYIRGNPIRRLRDCEYIHLGVSVENQDNLWRLDELCKVSAAVKFVSFEPLLEKLNLVTIKWQSENSAYTESRLKNIDWVIIGAESGPKRRECKLEWVKDIVEQCKAANVPIFVKQLSINGKVEHDITKFPKDLWIRRWPNK